MQALMKEMMQAKVTPEELKEFASLWQDRVARIFENLDSVVKVEVA